jgi:ABC-type microcin C transport system permease subunit YejE
MGDPKTMDVNTILQLIFGWFGLIKILRNTHLARRSKKISLAKTNIDLGNLYYFTNLN